MYFSINAYKFIWGLDSILRLQKDRDWKEIDNPHIYNETSDMLFNDIESAYKWLELNNPIKIDNQYLDLNEQITDLMSDKYEIEIIVHRLSPPKKIHFSKEELSNLLEKGDDQHTNVLVINFDGKLELVQSDFHTPLTIDTYAVRYESFASGNGYVGSKLDERTLSNIYKILLEGWEQHLSSNRLIFKDVLFSDRSEKNLQEDINSVINNNFIQKHNEAEFQAFANNPELSVFYKELPESDEEAVERLRKIWDIIKHEKK